MAEMNKNCAELRSFLIKLLEGAGYRCDQTRDDGKPRFWVHDGERKERPWSRESYILFRVFPSDNIKLEALEIELNKHLVRKDRPGRKYDATGQPKPFPFSELFAAVYERAEERAMVVDNLGNQMYGPTPEFLDIAIGKAIKDIDKIKATLTEFFRGKTPTAEGNDVTENTKDTEVQR